MADPQGFLKYRRLEPESEEPSQRLRHYREFHEHLSKGKLREQCARCMDCGVPFCHSVGCPLGNLIPEFNDLVYKGRWRDAVDCLHQTNNFPEITGRLCPALCEAACVNRLGAEAVSIRQIELEIVEQAWAGGWIEPMTPTVETGKTVAVIGSGPAGLAAAQQLRRAGHMVTVFEKSEKPGGLLRYGIPDFKLEKHIIDRRLAQMTAEGVKFETGVDAGIDLAASYFLKKFDAVCLCGGAGVPRDLPIPGRDADGIYFALQYLTQNNRRVEGVEIPGDQVIDAAGKRVVVVGGGDTGSDCLGTALRQGAASVRQIEIMPKPPEGDNPDTPWPRWPLILRTSSSHEEGGERQWCVSATEFKVEDGHVTGLKCQQVRWEEESDSGRMTMSPVPDSEFELDADLVLLAMGFVHPVHDGLLDNLGVEYDRRGAVKVDERMMSSVDGVFAAGDMQTGAWLIVGAIAGARRMARQVDIYLMGESCLPDCDPLPRL